jgi:hypothetical protein
MTTISDLAADQAGRIAEAFGGETITPLKEAGIARTAELLALAQSMRGRIIAEGKGDLAALVRTEELAAAALAALNVPTIPATPPQPLEVEFIDPRLDKLSDEQLARLEEIVAVMDGKAPVEEPPSAEQIALATLRDENERLYREIEGLHRHYSSVIREYERARCERANASGAPDQQTSLPEPSLGHGEAPERPSSNVVRLRSDDSSSQTISALRTHVGGIAPVTRAPHLDARKSNWPVW